MSHDQKPFDFGVDPDDHDPDPAILKEFLQLH